ncbi:hypothetical protein [Rhizobium phage RHph_X3_9]|nr:hypothetical protein [Rhizobium phage RHph_X3_9]
MCTGLELLVGLGAAGSAAATLFAPQPKAPKVQTPAVAPEAARNAGATVRVGVRDEVKEEEADGEAPVFKEQRKQAQTLSGLGRGGLAI